MREYSETSDDDDDGYSCGNERSTGLGLHLLASWLYSHYIAELLDCCLIICAVWSIMIMFEQEVAHILVL